MQNERDILANIISLGQEITQVKDVDLLLEKILTKAKDFRNADAGSIYIKKDNIKTVKSGVGISIISTSKGIMSNIDARKQNIGGEVLCEIY